MKTKTILLAFLAVTAGVFAFTRMNNAPPSDLRDAPGDFNTAIPAFEKDKGSVPDPKPAPAAVGGDDLVLVKEYTYQASEADSKLTARDTAIEALKRLALEEAGTNILSQTTVENNMLVMDKIVSVAAGVAKTQILDEKWDGSTYYCKARITIDAKSLLKLKETAAFYEANPQALAPAKPVKWVTIPGGKFMMGTDSNDTGFEDAKPVHEVDIKTFEMSKTAVTVEQYAECVDKRECTEPDTGKSCNWRKTGRQFDPVNCVDWNQASRYAKFKGARLPSESEWEYAARSGGKNQKYPWGNGKPTCQKAVIFHYGKDGYSENGTMRVCSKPDGNTAQGLCDMAGNVWQWVQDRYLYSYEDVPADGSAFEGAVPDRVMRGGSFNGNFVGGLRATYRYHDPPSLRDDHIGFRLAR